MRTGVRFSRASDRETRERVAYIYLRFVLFGAPQSELRFFDTVLIMISIGEGGSFLSLSSSASCFCMNPAVCEFLSCINFPRIPCIVIVCNDCLLIVQGQRQYINGPRIKWQQRGVVEHNPS